MTLRRGGWIIGLALGPERARMSNEKTEITQTIDQYFCRKDAQDSLIVDYRRDDKLIEFRTNHDNTIILNKIDAIQLAKDILSELLLPKDKDAIKSSLKLIAVPYPTDNIMPIILIRDIISNDGIMNTCLSDLIKRYMDERKTIPMCILVSVE